MEGKAKRSDASQTLEIRTGGLPWGVALTQVEGRSSTAGARTTASCALAMLLAVAAACTIIAAVVGTIAGMWRPHRLGWSEYEVLSPAGATLSMRIGSTETVPLTLNQ